MNELALSQEEAEDLQEFVSRHITNCWEYLAIDNMDPDEDEISIPKDFQPYGPYCGCQTCETREYLMSTFQWLKDNNKIFIFVD